MGSVQIAVPGGSGLAMSALLAAAACIELVLTAVVDARERRFPHPLFVLLAITCAALSLFLGGPSRLVRCAAMASMTCLLLMVFEITWRHMHNGRPGMGMGDIKYLFALSLWRPLEAMMSLTCGLVLLAASCLVTHRESMPLLPFAVPVFAVAMVAFGG